MYEQAYKAGHRTAFVSLNGESNNWDNGKKITSILEKISKHFNAKVNIVAHSKGGIDVQTALVHYGATPYVHDVITLATPFHGTALADLAYSAPAKWLMELLGKLDSGTESLQTGNMKYVREITDSNPNALKNTYYTSAGTDWGPAFSASWFGGMYLSVAGGQNDGQVNVSNTRLPYGKELFVASLTHDGMHQGSKVFDKINPILQKNNNGTQQLKGIQTEKNNLTPKNNEKLITGGTLPVDTMVEEKISIDSSIQQATFQILTKYDDTHIEFSSPSGKIYNSNNIKTISLPTEHIFGDSYLHNVTINQPEIGEWKVSMKSSKKDAYFMFTHFKAPSIISVDVDSSMKINTSTPLQVKIEKPELLDLKSIKIKVKEKESQQQINVKSMKVGQDYTFIQMIQTPNKTGTVNMMIEMEGKTIQGTEFKRTEIRSIHVSK
ncbi:lipase [Bacillus cereus]